MMSASRPRLERQPEFLKNENGCNTKGDGVSPRRRRNGLPATFRTPPSPYRERTYAQSGALGPCKAVHAPKFRCGHPLAWRHPWAQRDMVGIDRLDKGNVAETA